MSTTTHSQWGRPIDVYISDCGAPPNEQYHNSLPFNHEIEALQAVQSITEVAGSQGDKVWKIVDTHTLESAHNLALDTETIRHLANPQLITSCIQLMKSIKSLGTVSPFSYENGYLSFRILVNAINVCLLQRWDRLDIALGVGKRLDSNFKAADFVSDMVDATVEEKLGSLAFGGDCDSFLGWKPARNRNRFSPLLLQSEASTLLELLWKDRKHFLRVMRGAPLPGLLGLIFIVFRLVSQMGHTNPKFIEETPQAKLYELILRYLLVARQTQGSTLKLFLQQNIIAGPIWKSQPAFVDPPDARMILESFTRYYSKPTEWHSVEGPLSLFVLVRASIDPQSQDLLPEVIRSAIDYTWTMILGDHAKNDLLTFIQCKIDTLYLLIKPTYYSNTWKPSTRSQILDVIRKQEFLDLVARFIILLKPAATIHTPEASKNKIVEKSLACLFDEIAALSTGTKPDRLKHLFEDYTSDWRKVDRYLCMKRFGLKLITEIPSSYDEHQILSMRIWRRIAVIMGFPIYPPNVDVMFCWNGRCPLSYLEIRVNLQFTCRNCAEAVYCNDHCQAMDWMDGSCSRSHRERCRKDTTCVRFGESFPNIFQ